MVQTRFLLICAFSCFAFGSTASIPDYFPLRVGNQWIYQQLGAKAGEPLIVEVLENEVIADREYFLVAGLTPAAAWLRASEDGILHRLDRESGREEVWAVFSAREGQSYRTSMDPCSPVALVESVSGRVEVPAGAFANALAIRYPLPGCADAGLESDAFVPSVGLVRRTSATIAGPLVLCLIYARVGETTVLSQPEVTFGLSLDRSVYSPHLTVPELMVKITLRVRQGLPLELTFPSAQRFELTIRNADGKEVYRWSDGMAFAQMVGTERFGPAEKNWLVRVPLRSRDGNQFPPGKYTAASWLTSIGEPRYAASVGFEIAPWREPVTGLAGNWIFEARTSDGLLRARLALEEDGEKLSATLRIDNHVLKGEGKSDGTQFEVKL